MPPGAFGEPERVDKNRCFQIHLDIPFLDAGTFILMILFDGLALGITPRPTDNASDIRP